MTQEEIKNLIGYKEDRAQVLKNKKQSLVDLEAEISKSKLKRTVQSAFYTVKYFFLMFCLILSLLIGVVGLIYPNALFLNSSKFKSDFVDDYKSEYQKETSKNLEISFKEIQGNSKFTSKTLEQNIDKSVTTTAVKNSHFYIRVIAFVFLCFAGIIWYLIKMNNKLKESDKVIEKVIKTNQEIIKDYELSIDEENREISDLKQKLS
ncbi:hypothetical protein [Flavobacterium haoranii]|uniref:Uncharacterized protein n=1 Tax=Flavobacterium haoranii TaxID=683124 RepID=A0A1M6I184_9FLAO|nr:hypothetical protein [Flavobacterium haoranii]SHJ28175.1 hypothetical protein SAMN05444337_1726 [Flavobacterium haoranii]